MIDLVIPLEQYLSYLDPSLMEFNVTEKMQKLSYVLPVYHFRWQLIVLESTK